MASPVLGSEGGLLAALFLWRRNGCVWQYAVYGVYGCVAVCAVSEGFYSLPHASGVVSSKVFFYTLLVPAFGLSNASPQACPCLFVGLQVPRFECRVPCSEQGPHFSIETTFFGWVTFFCLFQTHF